MAEHQTSRVMTGIATPSTTPFEKSEDCSSGEAIIKILQSKVKSRDTIARMLSIMQLSQGDVSACSAKEEEPAASKSSIRRSCGTDQASQDS